MLVETKLRTGGGGNAPGGASGQPAGTRGAGGPQSLKPTLQFLCGADPQMSDRVPEAADGGKFEPHCRIGAVLEARHRSESHLQQLKNSYAGVRSMPLAADVVRTGALCDLAEESYAKAGRSNA